MSYRLRRLLGWFLDGAGYAAACPLTSSEPGDVSGVEEVGRVPPNRQPPMVGATAEAVGRECEAFLSGRYYELLRNGAGAPGWVYVNAVARAGRQELEWLAKRSAIAE